MFESYIQNPLQTSVIQKHTDCRLQLPFAHADLMQALLGLFQGSLRASSNVLRLVRASGMSTFSRPFKTESFLPLNVGRAGQVKEVNLSCGIKWISRQWNPFLTSFGFFSQAPTILSTSLHWADPCCLPTVSWNISSWCVLPSSVWTTPKMSSVRIEVTATKTEQWKQKNKWRATWPSSVKGVVFNLDKVRASRIMGHGSSPQTKPSFCWLEACLARGGEGAACRCHSDPIKNTEAVMEAPLCHARGFEDEWWR